MQIKAEESGQSISELVNQAVKIVLAEEAEDLAAFEERRHEPDLPFEDVMKDLKLSEDQKNSVLKNSIVSLALQTYLIPVGRASSPSRHGQDALATADLAVISLFAKKLQTMVPRTGEDTCATKLFMILREPMVHGRLL